MIYQTQYMNIPQSSNANENGNLTIMDPSPSNQDSNDSEEEPLLSKKQMKELINGYVNLNNKLMDKINELEEELSQKNSTSLQNSFHQDYSILQTDFSEIEQLLNQYRVSLKLYREQQQAVNKEKNETIDNLAQQNTAMAKRLEDQCDLIEELQVKNTALEEIKQNLLLEIQQMENNLQRFKLAESKIIKKNSQISLKSSSYNFNENVQIELEKLINKLMKELEHEQSSKKKLNTEIKRLQSDILELEKEVIDKNNKIYSLELKAIKNNKSYANLTLSGLRPNHKSPPLIHNFSFDGSIDVDSQKTKRKDNKNLGITLTQLSNESLSLQFEQKLHLCIKVIEAYSEKFEKNELTLEEESSISIHNFSSKQPHLYSVRFIKRASIDSKKEINAQLVLENMLEMLEAILGKKKRKYSTLNSHQKGVLLILSNMKKKKSGTLEELTSLKSTLQQLIGADDKGKLQ